MKMILKKLYLFCYSTPTILLFLLLLVCAPLQAQKYVLPKLKYTDEEIKEHFPAICNIKYKYGGKRKTYDFDYTAKNAVVCTPDNLMTDYNDLLGLRACDSVAFRDSKKYRKKLGAKYDGQYNYDYFFKNIPVKSTGVRLNMYEEKVKNLVMAIFTPPEEMSVVPSISHEEAKKVALNAPHIKGKKLYYSTDEIKGKLLILPANYLKVDSFRLIYRFGILLTEPYIHSRILYIDAHTPKLVHNFSNSLHATPPCISNCTLVTDTPVEDCNVGTNAFPSSMCNNFTSVKKAVPTIGNMAGMGNSCRYVYIEKCTTDPNTVPGIFRLSQPNVLPLTDVRNYNSSNPTMPLGNLIAFPDEDDLGTDYRFEGDVLVGTSVLWSVRRAYKYFQNAPITVIAPPHTTGIGIDSYDGMGSRIDIVVNSDYTTNARWVHKEEFQDANGNVINTLTLNQIHITETSSGAYQYANLQTISHEYAHGVMYNHFGISDLTSLETKAIHEGLSDVFAILTDRYTASISTYIDDRIGSWGWSWLGKRHLNDPGNSEVPVGGGQFLHQADTYEGNYWDSTIDNVNNNILGKQYLAAGIPAYWFYLLAQGGDGQPHTNDKGDTYIVHNIGIDKTQSILVKALNNLKVSQINNPTFFDLRHKTIEAAWQLYGHCSQEEKQTARAWHAVGVGNAWSTGCETCYDGLQSPGENGVDCGGVCPSCDDEIGCDEDIPTIDGSYSPPTENVTMCVGVGQAINGTVIDEDGDNVTISIDSGNFPVFTSHITFDYYNYYFLPTEAQIDQSFLVVVSVTDECDNTTTKEYTITVRCGSNYNCPACPPPPPCSPSNISITTSGMGTKNCQGNITQGVTISLQGNDLTNCNQVQLMVHQTVYNSTSVPNAPEGEYPVTLLIDGEVHSFYDINVQYQTQGSLNCSISTNNCQDSGPCNGSVTVATSGGTGQYSYNWNYNSCDGASACLNLNAGSYTVTVTDNISGCTCSGTGTVEDPPTNDNDNDNLPPNNGGGGGSGCAVPHIGVKPNIFTNATVIDFGANWVKGNTIGVGVVDGGTLEPHPWFPFPKEPAPIIITAQHVGGKRTTIYEGTVPYNTPQKMRIATSNWTPGLYIFTIRTQTSRRSCPFGRGRSVKAIKIGRGG